ncbi:ABC transporter permease [Sphaerotilus mobilis]|uniref:Putative thiamine transport system permease protein n=1 Tax=Sphaerotilus mobilis TaxID=47994 RepID=A0A4Q7LEB7_9BURK|nr:ABC transporter permease subunit [Sphaerotilus mobilis]RZS52342.1 putative thiamine transport system permease protein [Sphaerotilus mobilis]
MTPPDAPTRRRPWSVLAWARPLTLLAFTAPIAAGLLGTLLPAFGYLPAIGGSGVSLQPWRELLAAPGVASALALTLATGWSATLLSLLLAVGIVAALHPRGRSTRLAEWLAPLLAMPHAALAIGLAFLISPSGWLVRWVSPAWTGWDVPPDVATIGHPSGWPVVLALLIKEVPYLVLMLLAALNQVPARAQVDVARSMGYGPAQAWLAVVLPPLWRQIRWPVYAVLAFSLSVVDVALVLGPGNPPTLAVLAVRWFADPDPGWIFPASAAAMVLLGVVAASLAVLRGVEHGIAAWHVRHLARGRRGGASEPLARLATRLGGLLLASAVLAVVGLVLWSFAASWRYPAALPTAWTAANWTRQAGSLALPALTTLVIGAASTLIALVLVLSGLEHESRSKRRSRAVPWLYLPLLVPQVAFLFGLQVLLVRLGADGRLLAVIACHLVFVLPYLHLSLADPWRALDPRLARTAASLGASPARIFWRVKLPVLLRPVLLAAAIGFAVSAGQYLPTLYAGAGRVATLTTEAVTLASGADRRVIGTWALLQALLPLLAYLAAATLPRLLYRHRRGLA